MKFPHLDDITTACERVLCVMDESVSILEYMAAGSLEHLLGARRYFEEWAQALYYLRSELDNVPKGAPPILYELQGMALYPTNAICYLADNPDSAGEALCGDCADLPYKVKLLNEYLEGAILKCRDCSCENIEAELGRVEEELGELDEQLRKGEDVPWMPERLDEMRRRIGRVQDEFAMKEQNGMNLLDEREQREFSEIVAAVDEMADLQDASQEEVETLRDKLDRFLNA